MPRSSTTGVFTRVSNSFSSPVFGTLIDPADAESYFDDLDVGLNPPELDGPVRIIDKLQVGTTGTADGTVDFLNATSGSITLAPPAGALGTQTLTLPAATDTLVGKDTTDTLTNKTLTSPTLNSPTLVTPSLGVATATSINKVAITAPASAATLTIPDGVTLTGPAASGTAMTLGNTETVTGVKTFGSAGAVGRLKIAGTTSGSTILDATAIASGTLTLPAATDTLVGKATTDVLTNKTFNSTAAGNVLQVGGVTVFVGQYPAETSTGSATAGNIGEGAASTILSGSAVSLSTGTPKDITSITLAAGDWLIEAQVCFTGNVATTVTGVRGSISTTLDTENTAAPNFVSQTTSGTLFSVFDWGGAIAPIRVSLSGSTTYHLVARANFAVNTCSAYGSLRAWRPR